MASYETPILVGGGASDQTIWQVVEDSRHPVGQVAELSDGRRFVYACNRGSAIATGKLIKMTEPAANDSGLAVNTAAVGDTTLDIVFGGNTTLAANQLAGGYINVEDDDGEGQLYRIEGHPALAAATDLTVTIEPIRVAFAAATTVGVIQNPYNNVAITDANFTQKTVGATQTAVGAGSTDPQYFWAQTYGPASVLCEGTPGVGVPLENAPNDAGAVAAANEVDTAGAYKPVIAYMLDLAGIDTEHATVFLQL